MDIKGRPSSLNLDSFQCPICAEGYNCTDHRVRSLGCGHSYCTTCLSHILKNEMLLCPECRMVHSFASVTEIPVNYALENVSISTPKLHAGMCEDHAFYKTFHCDTCRTWICSDCTVTDHNPSKCQVVSIKEALKNKMLKADATISSQISSIDETKKWIHKQSQQLQEKKRKHLQHMKNLAKLYSLHEEAVNDIESARDYFQSMIEEGHVHKTLLKDTQKLLTEKMTSENELSEEDMQLPLPIKTTESWLTNIYKWVAEREKETYASMQLLESTSQALTTLNSSINDNIDDFQNCLTLQWTKKDLSQLLENQTVYASKETQHGIRYSKLKMENGHLCLHVLQNTKPIGHTLILPYSSVRSSIDNENALVFLDIQSDSTPLGRLYIKILGRTPRGDQFVSLNTGELGPSYHNLNFKTHSKKDQPGEWVSSSAYDGKDAAPLFKVLNDGSEYTYAKEAGLVTAACGNKEKGIHNARFGVQIQSDEGHTVGFARVQSGLCCLQAALRSHSAKDIRISTCGLVIPLG